MIKQLRFIPFILREIEDIDHIFAMDILMYLYKKRSGSVYEEIFRFFNNKTRLFVWETLMRLTENDFIINSKECNSFIISSKGIEKVEIAIACLKL